MSSVSQSQPSRAKTRTQKGLDGTRTEQALLWWEKCALKYQKRSKTTENALRQES